MQITVWIVVAATVWFAVGGIVAVWLDEPERDGWFWRVILWPLELYARRA